VLHCNQIDKRWSLWLSSEFTQAFSHWLRPSGTPDETGMLACSVL